MFIEVYLLFKIIIIISSDVIVIITIINIIINIIIIKITFIIIIFPNCYNYRSFYNKYSNIIRFDNLKFIF